MSKETTSNKTKKRVASFFGRIVVYILVLVLIAGIPFAYKFGHSVFYASSVDSPPGRNIQVNVAEGMSFDTLADTLYDKGVIENKFSFENPKVVIIKSKSIEVNKRFIIHLL